MEVIICHLSEDINYDYSNMLFYFCIIYFLLFFLCIVTCSDWNVEGHTIKYLVTLDVFCIHS